MLGALEPNFLNFVGFFATAAASATALVQMKRHDELARSYDLAAGELNRIKVMIERSDDEESCRKHISDSESTISREHTMWAAKRSG